MTAIDTQGAYRVFGGAWIDAVFRPLIGRAKRGVPAGISRLSQMLLHRPTAFNIVSYRVIPVK